MTRAACIRTRAVLWAPLLTALVLLAARPASAQQCAPAGAMRDWLSGTFGEARVFEGLSAEAMVVLWLSPAGSWTFVATRPDGVSCIVAAGEAGTTALPAASVGTPG